MYGGKRENSFGFGSLIIGIHHCTSKRLGHIGRHAWTATTEPLELKAKA
jgi:hypothetical protein